MQRTVRWCKGLSVMLALAANGSMAARVDFVHSDQEGASPMSIDRRARRPARSRTVREFRVNTRSQYSAVMPGGATLTVSRSFHYGLLARLREA